MLLRRCRRCCCREVEASGEGITKYAKLLDIAGVRDRMEIFGPRIAYRLIHVSLTQVFGRMCVCSETLMLNISCAHVGEESEDIRPRLALCSSGLVFCYALGISH